MYFGDSSLPKSFSALPPQTSPDFGISPDVSGRNVGHRGTVDTSHGPRDYMLLASGERNALPSLPEETSRGLMSRPVFFLFFSWFFFGSRNMYRVGVVVDTAASDLDRALLSSPPLEQLRHWIDFPSFFCGVSRDFTIASSVPVYDLQIRFHFPSFICWGSAKFPCKSIGAIVIGAGSSKRHASGCQTVAELLC